MKQFALLILISFGLISCSNPMDKSIFEPLSSNDISKALEGNTKEISIPNDKTEDTINVSTLDLIIPFVEILNEDGNISEYDKTKYKDISYMQLYDGVNNTVEELWKYKNELDIHNRKDSILYQEYLDLEMKVIDSVLAPFELIKKDSREHKKLWYGDIMEWTYVQMKDDESQKRVWGRTLLKKEMPEFKSYRSISEMKEDSDNQIPPFDFLVEFNKINPNIEKLFSSKILDIPMSPFSIKVFALLKTHFGESNIETDYSK